MSNQVNVNYLYPLVDKVVRVNKGGPESKVGRLLAVSGDYIVIHTEENEVLFYNAEHIKNVSEDSKEKFKLNYSANLSKLTLQSTEQINLNLLVPVEENKVALIERNSLGEILTEMIGLNVRINQGGPESRKGTLLGVYSNYVVLNSSDDGVLYYNLHHIKSVNAVVVNQSEENAEQGDATSNNGSKTTVSENVIESEPPSFLDVDTIIDVYGQLKNRWVRINRGGPDTVEGILVDISESKLVLVNGQEVFYIPTFHIKNVNHITQDANQQNSNNNETGQANNNSDNNTNESSNGKKKSTSKKNGNGHKKSNGQSRKRSKTRGWKLAKSTSSRKKSSRI